MRTPRWLAASRQGAFVAHGDLHGPSASSRRELVIAGDRTGTVERSAPGAHRAGVGVTGPAPGRVGVGAAGGGRVGAEGGVGVAGGTGVTRGGGTVVGCVTVRVGTDGSAVGGSVGDGGRVGASVGRGSAVGAIGGRYGRVGVGVGRRGVGVGLRAGAGAKAGRYRSAVASWLPRRSSPPTNRALPSCRAVSVPPNRGPVIGIGVHLSVASSNCSAMATVAPVVTSTPPAIKTRPSTSSVAACSARSTLS